MASKLIFRLYPRSASLFVRSDLYEKRRVNTRKKSAWLILSRFLGLRVGFPLQSRKVMGCKNVFVS